MNTCFQGPVTKDGNRLAMSLLLDPSQPYLAHHKVGGTPLLGTVMGIEAMGSVAALAGFSGKICVQDVRGLNPCFVQAPRTICIEVVLDEDKINSRVLDRIEGREEVYFTARMNFGVFDPPKISVPQFPKNTVSGEEVYRLYFHGPAFQVIEKAWLMDGVMYTKMNRSVPPAFNQGIPVTAPRLIELCLQTAGLWEVAFSCRMLIPEVIGRTVVHEKIDEAAAELIASAHRGPGGMDIFLFDPAGKVYVEVSGYRTVPLSIPIDESVIQNLKAKFHS